MSSDLSRLKTIKEKMNPKNKIDRIPNVRIQYGERDLSNVARLGLEITISVY